VPWIVTLKRIETLVIWPVEQPEKNNVAAKWAY